MLIPFTHLCGVSDAHITQFEHPNGWACWIHKDLQRPLLELCKAAAQAGFDLRVASGFRSYERQVSIWEAKASGAKPVLDANERALDRHNHDDWAWVQAILRWSALPGASRHHWGTEIDIFDLSSLPKGYRLQLTREETLANGPMGQFYQWLDEYLSNSSAEGNWRRPYFSSNQSTHIEAESSSDVFGVAQEPWHLSYHPLAKRFEQAFDATQFKVWLSEQPLSMKNTVLEYFGDIDERFIRQYFAG